MLSIYRASAGSGKTFTLAYEYIKLLLGTRDHETGRPRLSRGGNHHRNILAITFTNKATNEMKRRIVHELAVLARMEKGWKKESPYMDRLTKHYGASKEEVSRAAREALLHLLFDFNYFQVSTIDAFFQMILRTFAREAELTGNYELELDSKFAVRTGVDGLLNSVNHDSESESSRRVVKWISDYLLREMDEGRFSNLFDRSNKFYKGFVDFIDDISDETFAFNYGRMMEYLSDPSRLVRFQAGLYREIDGRRSEAIRLVEECLRSKETSSYETKFNNYLFPALAKWLEMRGARAATSTVAKVAGDIEAAYLKAGLAQRERGDYDAALEHQIEAACRAVASYDSETKLLSTTAKNLFVLGLLDTVYRFIAEARSDNNTLLLSDTNSLLYNIIGDDDTPFVYERTGVWYHNFLIDEFQDTSKMQWENLHPLLSQGLANGHESLIIGDEKQCIYRFRDSDPTLLTNQVAKRFEDFIDPENAECAGNSNWRSSVEVVEFNNRLFSLIAEREGFSDIYSNVVQKVELDKGGYVKVRRITVARGDDALTPALETLCEDIDRQLRAGYRPGQIAILTRWRAAAAKCIDFIERRLKQPDGFCRHFRLISDDALLLGSSPAVRLVISVLRYIENSELQRTIGPEAESPKPQRGATSRLINRFEYLSATSDDASEALIRALESSDIAPGGDGSDKGNDDTHINIDMVSSGGHASLMSLVDEIIVKYLSPPTRSEENMYIAALQDAVLDFSQRGGNDLHGFLAWWDTNWRRLTVSAPEDDEAIRIMTIHKSKGLEFDCVHIPFADWDLTSHKGYEWFEPAGLDGIAGIAPEDIPPLLPFTPGGMEGTAYEPQYRALMDEQRLDETNVMYVAMTRAVRELCVTTTRASSSSEKTKKKSPSESAKAGTTTELLNILTDEAESVDDGWVYTSGEPTVPDEKKSNLTALDPQGERAMRPYESQPREDLWQHTRLDSLPDLKEGRPRERGVVLHDVMSRVRSSSDIPGVIMKLTRQGRMRLEEAREVEEYLSEAVARVADKGWFDGTRRVLCERDIVVKQGGARRPDRVVWTADGTVDVIDYKFGEDNDRKYSRQVMDYMNILESLGEKRVRGYIWYIDRNRIVEVRKG